MDINFYIEKRLTESRNWYEKKASHCKKKHINSQIIIIILGAAIPLIITSCSFNDAATKVASVISAVLSTIITVIAGIDKLIQYQTNWYNFRAAEEILKKEEWLFNYRVGPYYKLNDEHASQLLVERVENVISADMARFANSKESKDDKETIDFIQTELKKAMNEQQITINGKAEIKEDFDNEKPK